jgi:hypothetical protein
MTTSRKRSWLSAAAACLLLLPGTQACNGTDAYYDRLTGIPQAALGQYSYRPNYAVGDTIDIYGYFGALDSDLHVRIGAVDGQLASRSSTVKNLQLVRVPVTVAMGLGAGRPVRFVLDGQTTEGPPIYIRAAGGTPVFKDTLEMVPTGFDFDPVQIYFVQSWTGTGRVFYFDLTAGTLNAWKDSVSTPLLGNFRDASGAFTITSVAGAGVDRKERYLYFSAATQDSGSTATVWRFSKIDLATKQLTTLNRTPGTLTGGPWEGPIAQVKLPLLPWVFVAESGEIYMSPSGAREVMRAATTAAGKIDAAGNVSYLAGSIRGTTVARPAMSFSNPGGGRGALMIAMDPDRHLFYRLDYVQSFNQRLHFIINVWDLEQGREAYSFAPHEASLGVPLVLDGPFEAVQYDQGGAWFVMNGRPVFFLSSSNTFNNVSAAVRVDFERRETETYAPRVKPRSDGSFISGTILNYTPDGQIIFKRSYERFLEPQWPLYTLERSRIKRPT